MHGKVYDIVDFGAKPGEDALNTGAIQEAINAASSAGGGVVHVPPGVFVSGTLTLKSNISLEIAPGAILKAAGSLEEYVPMSGSYIPDREEHHFLVGMDLENVSVGGRGTIDGNGPSFWEKPGKPRQWIPHLNPRALSPIHFRRCKNVSVSDCTLVNSPEWNMHLYECDDVTVHGIRIRGSLFGPNIDGIDIEGCRNVRVSDCDIDTGDDAVVAFPSVNRSCERVTVTNCTIRTNCAAFKAYIKQGTVRDLCFSNSVVYGSTRGVGLYLYNHGVIENVTIQNIVCDTDSGFFLNRPFQIMCEDQRSNTSGDFKGYICNIMVSNSVFRTDGRILMSASDGMRIENVNFRDVLLDYPAIDDPAATAVNIRSNQFPGKSQAGSARAAVVAENVSGLSLNNVRVQWPEEKSNNTWRGPLDHDGNSVPYSYREDFDLECLPFSVLWAQNACGGFLDCPLATAGNTRIEKYVLMESELTSRS